MLNQYKDRIKKLESSKFMHRKIIYELNNKITELEKEKDQSGHFKAMYEVSKNLWKESEVTAKNAEILDQK